MEGNSPTNHPSSSSFRSLGPSAPESLRHILVRKVHRLHQPKPKPKEEKLPGPPSRSITYTFVPYPVELSDMERQRTLPSVQLRLLALRRFANPMTGEFVTTTREVAELLGCDRSSAQKALRFLEAAHYLHMDHLRSVTVQLVVWFGGFAAPGYREEGKAPIRWDADFPPPATEPAHRSSQSRSFSHTVYGKDQGSTEREFGVAHTSDGTALRDRDIKNIDNRNKEKISTGSYQQDASLTALATFQPQSHDESVVQELARKMREEHINNFLALRRQYGLNRLERACAFAWDKLHDAKHPFRKKPGAFVRWLLNQGIC